MNHALSTNYLFPANHHLRHVQGGLDPASLTRLLLWSILAFLVVFTPDAIAAANVEGLKVDEALQSQTIATLESYWTYGANIVAFLFAAGLLISIIFAGGRGWWIFLLGALAAAFGDDAIKAIINAGSTTSGTSGR